MKQDFNLIKNLGYLSLALILVSLVVFFMIVPTIKEYRENSGNYRRAALVLEQTNNEYKEMIKDFNDLKRENKRVLQSFKKNFSIGKFLRDSRRFFKNTSIARIGRANYIDNFDTYEFNATSNIKEPKHFYDFLDYLSKYDNVIEADFPINFEQKENYIIANFKLKIYNTKE